MASRNGSIPQSPPIVAALVPQTTPVAEYNLRILVPLARYLDDRLGAEALAKVAASAGATRADFEPTTNKWVSWEQFETVLDGARALIPDDETFMRACSFRMAETMGVVRFAFWAATPSLIYATAERSGRLFSSVGQFRLTARGDNFAHLTWTSEKPESRLMCLSRQAQSRVIPTIWRQPPAFVREGKCIARGDDACEYQFYWFNRRRWLPTALGLIGAAALLFGGAKFFHWTLPWVAAAVPLLGAAVGHIYELRRANRANVATHTEVTDALRTAVEDQSDVRREILELNQRQNAWSRALEERATERITSFERVVANVEQVQKARETTLLGFSHDLRNPLTVLVTSIDYLRGHVHALGAEGDETLSDLELATSQMKRMLAELMIVATRQKTLLQITPQTFEVAPLTDRLRRRLRALVHGRDVRASVFATREAPESIDVDPLLFDRVLDNLLTNAAKYTERGSIVIEIDGTPEFLVLKISDTGRGIGKDELERVFRSGGSASTSRAVDSYGVGLSVVVQLLALIGGRIEVMSQPGKGTTFWVKFPVKALLEEGNHEESVDSVLRRVVKVRMVPA